MESIDLEMGDLFDNEAIGDGEDVGAQGAPLPGMDDDDEGPMRGEGEDGEMPDSQDGEDGVVANLQRLSKGAAKKRVMRPQPKLDPDRLKTERGLPVVPRIFQDVKFKGKGHENDDLKLMMGKLEHWAHRLFPKMPFDDFADRMEKLGAKKAVQTCMTRIRMDMPILDDEYIAQYGLDEGPEEPQEEGDRLDESTEGHGGHAGRNNEDDDMDVDDAFEEMMRQERELREKRKAENAQENGHDVTASRHINRVESDSEDEHEVAETRAKSPPRSVTKNTDADRPPPNTPATPTPSSQSMTPDAKARMEENKRKALEKRAARLGVPLSTLMSPKPSPAADSTRQSQTAESEIFSQKDANQETSQTESEKPSSDTPCKGVTDGQDGQVSSSNPESQKLQNTADNPSNSETDQKMTEDEILDDLLDGDDAVSDIGTQGQRSENISQQRTQDSSDRTPESEVISQQASNISEQAPDSEGTSHSDKTVADSEIISQQGPVQQVVSQSEATSNKTRDETPESEVISQQGKHEGTISKTETAPKDSCDQEPDSEVISNQAPDTCSKEPENSEETQDSEVISQQGPTDIKGS